MSVKRGKSKRHLKYGKGSRTCIRCGTHQGIIRSYGINMCRRCFRETAEKLGFRKFR